MNWRVRSQGRVTSNHWLNLLRGALMKIAWLFRSVLVMRVRRLLNNHICCLGCHVLLDLIMSKLGLLRRNNLLIIVFWSRFLKSLEALLNCIQFEDSFKTILRGFWREWIQSANFLCNRFLYTTKDNLIVNFRLLQKVAAILNDFIVCLRVV